MKNKLKNKPMSVINRSSPTIREDMFTQL